MTLDIVIIVLYIAGINLAGFLSSRAASLSDYFLGSRSISWPVVLFSIVATETSSLTFLSIPGLAYFTGSGFLQVAAGYVLGRVIVAWLLLPRYFAGNINTAYQFIQERFGVMSRRVMAVIFQITRVLADGVRLFATAIPLAMLMGTDDYRIPLAIISLATFAYTLYGGIRSVAVTDTIQLFVYLLSAVLALAWVGHGGTADFHGALCELVRPFGFSGIHTPGVGPGDAYTWLSGLVGGTLLSVASHGTDQLMVQRVMACRDLSDARKAMVGSGILVFFQFALFLYLGLVLRGYLAGNTFSRPDEVMAWFMVHSCPAGLRGLLLAGIFAAAMSTLASSINSLASSTVMDILGMDAWQVDEKRKVLLSRIISLAWTFLIAAVAFGLRDTKGALVELGLSIASLTYGGMLAIFIAGILRRRIGQGPALGGVFAGVAVVAALYGSGAVFWLWYVPAGFAASMAVILLLDSVFPEKG